MSINSIDHEEMTNIAHKWELPEEEETVVKPENNEISRSQTSH